MAKRIVGNGHESGQAMVEYALICALLMPVCFLALVALRVGIVAFFNSIVLSLS